MEPPLHCRWHVVAVCHAPGAGGFLHWSSGKEKQGGKANGRKPGSAFGWLLFSLYP